MAWGDSIRLDPNNGFQYNIYKMKKVFKHAIATKCTTLTQAKKLMKRLSRLGYETYYTNIYSLEQAWKNGCTWLVTNYTNENKIMALSDRAQPPLDGFKRVQISPSQHHLICSIAAVTEGMIVFHPGELAVAVKDVYMAFTEGKLYRCIARRTNMESTFINDEGCRHVVRDTLSSGTRFRKPTILEIVKHHNGTAYIPGENSSLPNFDLAGACESIREGAAKLAGEVYPFSIGGKKLTLSEHMLDATNYMGRLQSRLGREHEVMFDPSAGGSIADKIRLVLDTTKIDAAWARVQAKLDLLQQNMEKKKIGYKFKQGFEQYEPACQKILNNYPKSSIKGVEIAANSTCEFNLKKAGVLDIWFEPVYEEKFERYTFDTTNKGKQTVEIRPDGIYHVNGCGGSDRIPVILIDHLERLIGMETYDTFVGIWGASTINCGCCYGVPANQAKEIISKYNQLRKPEGAKRDSGCTAPPPYVHVCCK